MFEYHAIYDKVDGETSDLRRACLVWLGDEKSRPTYLGQVSDVAFVEFFPSFAMHYAVHSAVTKNHLIFCQGSRPELSPEMDTKLWEFVQQKGMDQKMFRALVSCLFILSSQIIVLIFFAFYFLLKSFCLCLSDIET